MKSVEYALRFALVGVGLMVTLPVLADNMPLPPGWRTPTGAELSDNWRNKNPDKYAVVRGDFNGDGVADQATLLVSLRGRGFGLFAFLSQKDHTFRAYEIHVTREVSFLQAMGITKVSPGKYKTACGKGYWDCKKGEVPEVSLGHDAIDLFKTESANSYLYWDEQTRRFNRIWMSD